MIPERVQVKYFVDDPAAVNPPDFIPVFHRWIREKTVDGLLIDVANYNHVRHGPGVMLIGHDRDYSLDFAGGRPGLLVSRKRGLAGTLADRVRETFALAQEASAAIKQAPELKGSINFRSDEVELSFPDRLNLPNSQETWTDLKPEIERLAAHFVAGAPVVTRVSEDKRRPFAVNITQKSD